MSNTKYYGKYRALVTKVEKPGNRATRIQVKCPSIYGDAKSPWCMPCIPFLTRDKFKKADDSPENLYRSPKVGEPVWIEFEGGNVSAPLWVGTWR